MNIYKEVQGIVDSYRNFPVSDIVEESLAEEVAQKIVDYVHLIGVTMDDFDFKELRAKVSFGQWKNI